MDRAKLKEVLSNVINSPTTYLKAYIDLQSITDSITENLVYNENPKERVLNLFLIDSTKTMQSFFHLLSDDLYTDALVLTRKIVETYIRVEYLSVKNLYDSYFKVKSQDQAKFLFSMLNSHHIKYVSETPLWLQRNRIIQDCKQILYDKNNNTFVTLPNLEGMAKETNLLYLYKNSYSALSKFTHANMVIENFHLVRSIKNKIKYSLDQSNFKELADYAIKTTIYCYYLIVSKYINELSKEKEKLIEFKQNHFIFAAVDLTTGRGATTVDITYSIIENINGKEIERDEDDIDTSVKFIDNDPEKLMQSWIELESLIKTKEIELQNMPK